MNLEISKQWEELNETNSTAVSFKGVEIKTTQDPYIKDNTYTAHAISVFGDEYQLSWNIINEETTDESETCDWEHPSSIKSGGMELL